MTYEPYPLGGATTNAPDPDAWYGLPAEPYAGVGDGSHGSHVQAAPWSTGPRFDAPASTAWQGVHDLAIGNGISPGPSSYGAFEQDVSTVHSTHQGWYPEQADTPQWETACPSVPDVVGVTDASGQWGAGHAEAPWWTETAEPPAGDHIPWGIPAHAFTDPEPDTSTLADATGNAAEYEDTADDSRSAADGPDPAVPAPRRPSARGRRAPARRSALLSVAAPSVAVLGMAGFAGASVGLGGKTSQAAQTAPDTSPADANRQLDTQLARLSDGADDFADRASRAQDRVDLEQKRLEEQKRRQEEAARKRAEAARREALRPKFALPVAQRGVGELFGAVGSMWSNRHTGLDFPVPMYTPVMAVTDGTVEAKWNQFYGNMVIVTAPDGTETWYCHLASARIRSGHVKAGEVIAYAGSSGNSSGPHLHLEVHPGGGAAIDPLAWLRSHGLDPT